MTLKLRRNNLAQPGYPDRSDYSVMSNELVVGRIYDVHSGPEELRWFWAVNGVHAPMVVTTSGKVATVEIAKAQLADNWRKWLAWAGLQEVEPTPAEPRT
jgi:hypothetical protein